MLQIWVIKSVLLLHSFTSEGITLRSIRQKAKLSKVDRLPYHFADLVSQKHLVGPSPETGRWGLAVDNLIDNSVASMCSYGYKDNRARTEFPRSFWLEQPRSVHSCPLNQELLRLIIDIVQPNFPNEQKFKFCPSHHPYHNMATSDVLMANICGDLWEDITYMERKFKTDFIPVNLPPVER